MNIKTVEGIGKKIVSLLEIQEYMKTDNYKQLVEYIKSQVEQGLLIEVKNSKSNGMVPPLYNRYRVNPPEEDFSGFEEEINYNFPFVFKRDYYVNNLKKYGEEKGYIDALIHYFRNCSMRLKVPMSVNERSFEIWGIEKFLKEGSGQSILKNLGLSMENLNIYTTPEPFVYFSCIKERNQKVLIIENKDTWYTLRRLMIEGQASFLGERIDTIIYGSGKNIEKSLQEYEFTVEEYLLQPAKMLYWGDIDYEGIGIYERLKKRYSSNFNIQLFKGAYITMLESSEGREMPKYSEKQNKNIDEVFLSEMAPCGEQILKLFAGGSYIPQEIVNYGVLREGLQNV